MIRGLIFSVLFIQTVTKVFGSVSSLKQPLCNTSSTLQPSVLNETSCEASLTSIFSGKCEESHNVHVSPSITPFENNLACPPTASSSHTTLESSPFISRDQVVIDIDGTESSTFPKSILKRSKFRPKNFSKRPNSTNYGTFQGHSVRFKSRVDVAQAISHYDRSNADSAHRLWLYRSNPAYRELIEAEMKVLFPTNNNSTGIEGARRCLKQQLDALRQSVVFRRISAAVFLTLFADFVVFTHSALSNDVKNYFGLVSAIFCYFFAISVLAES